MKYEKVLLGSTKDNSIVFANIDCKDYFSVTFDEVAPVVVDYDFLKERVECLLNVF